MVKIVLILFSNNDVHKSIRIVRNVDSRTLRLKNGACSNEIPYVIVGRRKYPFLSANFFVTSDTISESVEIGKCGPCCSIEPIGIIAILFLLLINYLRIGSNCVLISVI